MASGHVNRTNRPNTWLHRPACKREEKPCQLGAVQSGLSDTSAHWSAFGRLCSLIPGFGVKLSTIILAGRAHCSLRGRGLPSA
jgi:hypothetical protein